MKETPSPARAVIGLRPSPKLQSFLKEIIVALKSPSLLSISVEERASDVECITGALACEYLSVRSVKVVAKHLKSRDLELSDYLKSCPLLYPVHEEERRAALALEETQARNANANKRREYLLMKAEEREYNRMMYGTQYNPHVANIVYNTNPYASMRNQITISTNMVVSILSVFGISYYVGTYYSDRPSTHLVFGLVGAIGIMLVEMVIYIIRAVRMEDLAYEKEHSRHRGGDAQQATAVTLAQMRSGSLITAPDYRPSDYAMHSSSSIEARASRKLALDEGEEEISLETSLVDKKNV